ncbi:TrmH family RNA methyltransferase [Thermospira aquatica]|uniref:tRNA/rRNA methyltransferase SpoU type domain-containing protein n=1 Tax=Thermospira aquatica TaxID=2828656 RepID=A0AAX3BEF8_9SPIR|nr:TrmH family RNA methyltransferase [Thermospira aquatica]URA10493.1 hypothetical protein KDW03_01440 [Thermospira aquatica]
MQREGFNKLSVSQKVRKLSTLARESARNPTKQQLFWECTGWIATDPHPRLRKAFLLIEKTKPDLLPSPHLWFHLSYELLALNNETRSEEDFLSPVFDREDPLYRWESVVILADIRSPFNVGSIIRTAEAFGWSEACLCGITPSVSNPRVAKTAMGTHEWIIIREFETVPQAIAYYKNHGYTIAALEVIPQSTPLWDTTLPEKTALIMGNEEFGIPEETLALVDQIVYIPLYGRKLSLNVANAFAITTAVLTRQWSLQREKTKTQKTPHQTLENDS